VTLPSGMHVYLPHVDGAYGDDIVLLNADLDLSSNLPLCGYTVTNFLPAERLSALIAARYNHHILR